MEDAETIRNYVDKVDSVVIIGGGLLGLEAGNNLLKKGKRVVVLETMTRLLPSQLDEKAAKLLRKLLEDMGFEFRVGVVVNECIGDQAGAVKAVRLENGEEIEVGMVLVTAGVRANLNLAKDMNLTCQRGIVVDSSLRTSCQDIYAAGDCAEYKGMVYGIWPAAMEQGRIAGRHMAGEQVEYHGSIMMNRLRVAGIDVASAGEIDIENQFESKIFEENGRYQKMIIDKGIIIGCILLGQTGIFGKLSKMIKHKKSIDELFI